MNLALTLELIRDPKTTAQFQTLAQSAINSDVIVASLKDFLIIRSAEHFLKVGDARLSIHTLANTRYQPHFERMDSDFKKRTQSTLSAALISIGCLESTLNSCIERNQNESCRLGNDRLCTIVNAK